MWCTVCVFAVAAASAPFTRCAPLQSRQHVGLAPWGPLTSGPLLLQGIVYGKPVNQGITQLKPNRNHRNMAEERVGRKCGGLRVLNSYWVNQVRKTYDVQGNSVGSGGGRDG